MNISESVPDLCMTLNNLDYRLYDLKLLKITKEKSATMVQRYIKFGTSSFYLCIFVLWSKKITLTEHTRYTCSFMISKRGFTSIFSPETN